jgi:hypothetical protein
MKRTRQEHLENPRPEKKREKEEAVVPLLPIELWTYILGFVPRVYIPPVRMAGRTFHQAAGPPPNDRRHLYRVHELVNEDAPLSFIEWASAHGCALDKHGLLTTAAYKGRLDVIHWENGGLDRPWKDMTCYAAQGGHIHVLDWIVQMNPEVKKNIRPCADAAVRGRLKTLRWLRKKGFWWNSATCAAAAKGGHVEVLAWARNYYIPCAWDESACVRAAEQGHLEVLQWLRSQDPPCPWNKTACFRAVGQGHLEVLQWLRSQDPPCPWDETVCLQAVFSERLDILQWLRSQDPPCPWSKDVCTEAARIGHLDILQWARAHGASWSKAVPRVAADEGHFDVLKWVISHGCPVGKSTCENVAGHGRLDLLQWLRSQDPPCPWDGRTCAAAVMAERLDILQWLRGQIPPCPWDGYAIYSAAVNGRWDIVKWARMNGCPWNDDQGEDLDGFVMDRYEKAYQELRAWVNTPGNCTRIPPVDWCEGDFT